MNQTFGIKVEAWELVDSRDHYISLTKQRNSVDRSIRGDVDCIVFVYKTELDFMGWIRESCNPADVGTKPNSPLAEPVVLMLVTGKISIDLSSSESRYSEYQLG